MGSNRNTIVVAVLMVILLSVTACEKSTLPTPPVTPPATPTVKSKQDPTPKKVSTNPPKQADPPKPPAPPEKDYTEEFRKYHEAAEDGDSEAMTRVGVMYEHGKGVKQDYEEALKWYHKAAALDFADAEYNIGAVYEYGIGVKQDYAEAMKWYRKAERSSHFQAMS